MFKKHIKNILIIITIFITSCQKQGNNIYPFIQSPPTKQRTIIKTSKYNCNQVSNNTFNNIALDLQNGDEEVVKNLPSCFKDQKKLFFKLALLNPEQIQYASDPLRNDKNFIRRLIKINPESLKYVSDKIKNDKIFMKGAIFLYRDALRYASKSLQDNKIFMKQMIKKDSRNYIFASPRIKAITDYAKIALNDNGMLLIYAPDSVRNNKDLVRTAFKSNNLAIKYANPKFQNEDEFKITDNYLIFNHQELSKFVNENYVDKIEIEKLGSKISNQGKFFYDNILIQRNYVTKWFRSPKDSLNDIDEKQLKLITVDSRNYQTPWKEDFKEYPNLISKIEKFLKTRNVDQITLNNLKTTYLWKVKDSPLTLAFNLYLLKNDSDNDLGEKFSNTTSLTAIVQKRENSNKWKMTVIEVIFDSETAMNVVYLNGHKKYKLWDLFIDQSSKDKSPKLIFKVESDFEEFFEIFSEKSGGKYEMIYRIKPNLTQKNYR